MEWLQYIWYNKIDEMYEIEIVIILSVYGSVKSSCKFNHHPSSISIISWKIVEIPMPIIPRKFYFHWIKLFCCKNHFCAIKKIHFIYFSSFQRERYTFVSNWHCYEVKLLHLIDWNCFAVPFVPNQIELKLSGRCRRLRSTVAWNWSKLFWIENQF